MTIVGRAQSLDGNHLYTHPVSGQIFPSVTSIISATNSKPWLAPWAAGMAATWTADHLEFAAQTFAEAGRDAVVDLVKGAAKRKREAAADVGSYIHTVVEALILGLPIPSIPDELLRQQYGDEPLTQELVDGIVDGFMEFDSDFDVEYEMAEVTVCNRRLNYAGTLDIGAVINLGDLGCLRLIVDIKTGVRLDSTMLAQLGAYSDPDNEVWLPNGQIEPLPYFEGAAVLHLRSSYATGYKVFHIDEATLAEGRAAFADMRRVFDRQQIAKGKPGRVIYPPLANGQQPLPLLEDCDGHTKARNLLIKAGHRTLAQVAAVTAADLLALKGFGKASLVQTVELLTAHNLTLAGSDTADGASQTEVA